jgi:RNA recognition motif-containing protein
MSTQNARSGRRSGHGSRRNRNRDREREPRSSAPKPPEKKTLWQKILAFFSGKKPQQRESASRQQNRNATATTTSSYPASTPAQRPARKPEAVEVTTAKVYVGNLSFDASESDLFELFKGIGGVQLAEVVSHSHTQKSKGFGFVTMASVEEAKRAVEVLHDREFMGRKLVVSGAKTPTDRR